MLAGLDVGAALDAGLGAAFEAGLEEAVCQLLLLIVLCYYATYQLEPFWCVVRGRLSSRSTDQLGQSLYSYTYAGNKQYRNSNSNSNSNSSV